MGRSSRSRAHRLATLLSAPGAGIILVVAFLSGIGLYGAMLGGEYAAFTKAQGQIPDFAARMLGFGIKGVTISGAHDLSEKQILDTVGIGRNNSLLFLDVGRLRGKLLALPLVKDASVSKLYPNRVMIEVVERQAFALWQKDGAVKIIAADGTPLTALNEARFANLPLVVGDCANERIGQFRALLDAAGDLRPRIKAGMLIAQRRWTLKMTNGIEVALPEIGAPAAVAELVRLQDKFRVLDKDIVSLDLRYPGRLIARLPDETANAQAALSGSKANAKGGQT